MDIQMEEILGLGPRQKRDGLLTCGAILLLDKMQGLHMNAYEGLS